MAVTSDTSTATQPRVLNRILVVDDDADTRELVSELLRRQNFEVFAAADGSMCLEQLNRVRPDLILLDVIMPDLDGFETLRRIRQRGDGTDLPVVFVSAIDDPTIIYRLFEAGGDDYVGKPVRKNELLARIRLHLELLRRARELEESRLEIHALRASLLSGSLERPEAFSHILTRSPQMLGLFRYIEAIATTARPVLITGATGTGKELFARAIHSLSERAGNCVPINVAGLDDTLFSDTLFGHARGAYTGATGDRKGLIEAAAAGTLFLDEIGDLGPQSQVKLLRLLQENEYYPLGSDRRKFSDARIVVATNRDLQSLIREGSFRQDLYYRLMTHHVHIPPLRERPDDLPLLLEKFVHEAATQLKRPPMDVDPALIQQLAAYDFPGNVRELESMVFDAVSRCRHGVLGPRCFRALPQGGGQPERARPTGNVVQDGTNGLPTLHEAGERLIDAALEQTGGNISQAARILGISRQALHRRLAKR